MVHTIQKWRILKMKIYRGVLWCLLVVFIAVTVIYIAYFYNEQRSTDGGTLIWRVEDVSGNRIC